MTKTRHHYVPIAYQKDFWMKKLLSYLTYERTFNYRMHRDVYRLYILPHLI